MKISEIFSYMQLEYSIRGDVEYNNNLSLNDFNITWISHQPADKEFHTAAAEYKNKLMQRNYSDAMQEHINAKARDKNYNDGFACASYANSTKETWKQEATDFIAWRDACWQYAIDVQNDVTSGAIDAPSVEDFITNAPTLNWS